MPVTVVPAAIVEIGFYGKTYTNCCPTSVTVGSGADLVPVQCGDDLKTMLAMHQYKTIQWEGVILTAGSIVPPAVGALFTIDGIEYICTGATVKHSEDAAKITLNGEKDVDVDYSP